jgi:dipeptidyl aminopeptidase/acylaminoacyl peptidase
MPTATARSSSADVRSAGSPATRSFGVDTLWQLERLGAPSLSPDGAQAVLPITDFSMDENRSRNSLLLLSTQGGEPRHLTSCGDKDGQPAWSPRGDRIAFIARREQQGLEDEEAQLYLIAPDGGEARRITTVATGVEGFKWFPDGKRIAFFTWVWPEERGAKAQARRLKQFKERKESAYVTSEMQYRFWDHNLPQGRVVHLCVLDLASGKWRDLFEGRSLELSRCDPDSSAFDISPDGRRICFVHDAAPVKRIENLLSLSEMELSSGRLTTLIDAQGADALHDCQAPRYSPEGECIALLTAARGRKDTLPAQLAVWQRATPDEVASWSVLSQAWDHVVEGPLAWEEDGLAVLACAEDRGSRRLWRFDIADRRAEAVYPAPGHSGWVSSYDKRAGTSVVVADSAEHPARAWALLPGQAPRRMERCNDAVLDGYRLGRSRCVDIVGALGDSVQLRLTFPPGVDPARPGSRKLPVLHLIHGGPHSVFGDNWHYRWNQQVFAAQGYVVACVNYHGSSGFGHAFLDAITHRWGELETQDIEAATDWLLAQPWVDAERIYAGGGSYGGYLVAWMNGHINPAPGQPPRYRAYVCHAGCFDWVGMFADDAYSGHQREFGAWYWDDPARVLAQSPHSYAARMHTPTLVMHGAQDYRVPDAQGLAYYNTLKARGVDARLVWFPDENHWVLKPRNSRLWYQEFLAWLGAHSGPPPDPAPRPKAAGG